MGRKAEGYRVRYRATWAWCRFTWQGVRYDIALGTRDRGEAEQAAARAYSDVVSGRLRPVATRPGQLGDLKRLYAEWVEWKRPSLDVRTVPSLEMYGRRFIDYFRSLDRITTANASSYTMARLGQVTRSTLLKELCFLRQFLRWCEEQGPLDSAPVVKPIPPKARGRWSGTQRKASVYVTEDEAMAIIGALPVESKTIGGRRWPIRDRFAFAYHTALRPETVSCLSVPDHWKRGDAFVVVTDEIDKARFGRTLDLPQEALDILNEHAPSRGLIFGNHVFTKALKAAAVLVLGATRGRSFSPYDFRHGRAKHLLDGGASLRGVSWILGHKRPSTTDKYLAPDRKEGAAVFGIKKVSR